MPRPKKKARRITKTQAGQNADESTWRRQRVQKSPSDVRLKLAYSVGATVPRHTYRNCLYIRCQPLQLFVAVVIDDYLSYTP